MNMNNTERKGLQNNSLRISQFEKQIGYTFKEKFYLERALTHSSYNKEKNTKHQDNERLEFLGDAFLDAIIAARIFNEMKGVREGRLTKIRALVVCEKGLAKVAHNYRLGEYMFLGHGEELAGGREKDSILADAMEAVIGAIYLDGGFEATEKFVLESFEPIVKEAMEGKLFSDYKSQLQEICQKNDKNSSISYVIDREEGPDHDKTFYVSVYLKEAKIGSGTGKNKKEAEQDAAKAAIAALERR